MNTTVHVALQERSYDIVIGERLLAEAGAHIAPLLKRGRVIIVTDETVARLYLHRLTNALEEHGISATPIVLPAGEQTKGFTAFAQLCEDILAQKPDRSTTLLALGGGVIGDITGFAASVILRGLDFIQLPTTLLAQVDSSVGGKTAINSAQGKNLIGSFHQPRLVLADISALASLPKRELLAGYAETVKYGLLGDAEFFAWCEANGAKLIAGDASLRTEAVRRACVAKARIVGEDEREAGARALLNFGHTFAHALEAETGYSDALLHGEAVAVGMVLAFALSVKLGLCAQSDLHRVRTHFAACGLPDSPKHFGNFRSAALMEHFTRDKKAKDGALTFVLARGIGEAFVADNVDAHAVRAVLEEWL